MNSTTVSMKAPLRMVRLTRVRPVFVKTITGNKIEVVTFTAREAF